jgi:hypothetical protein
VLEAHEFGFRIVPLDSFKKHNTMVALVTPKHPIDVGLRVVAHRYLGTMYDYAGLIGMMVVVVGRWFQQKWKNPFRGAKNVYCSEAVILAMKQSAGYERLDLDSDSSPQDLLNWFEKVEARGESV